MTSLRIVQAANQAQTLHRARIQAEAQSVRPAHNRILAASLAELFDERKLLSTPQELKLLAQKYDMDVEKIESIARHVNSPSVDEASVVRQIQSDGSEKITMTVSPSIHHS